MSELKHTPLPWRRNHRKDYGGVWRVYGAPHPVDGGDYAPLCEFSNPADADLVLTAVNSHHELLGALENVMRWFGKLEDWTGVGDPDIDAWRAVIKKARGENHD